MEFSILKKWTYAIVAFLAVTLVDRCWAASLLQLPQAGNMVAMYTQTNSIGIRIPVLLTESKQTKNYICNDIVNAFARLDAHVSRMDEETLALRHAIMLSNSDDNYCDLHESTCPVIVDNITRQTGAESSVPELMMECIAVIYDDNQLEYVNEKILVMSTIFPQSYFVVTKNARGLQPSFLAELSPELVEFTQQQLEVYYLNLRQPVEKIRRNYPDVAKLAETRDKFAILNETEIVRLCLSIFGSKFYEAKSTEYKNPVQIRGQKNYEILPLGFKTQNLRKFSLALTTENIVCECEENGGARTYLFVTHTYNDEDSVFVQRKLNDVLFLEAYMKNVPVLMHNVK